jgi:hypothetical protein
MLRPHRRLPRRAKILLTVAVLALLAAPIAIVVPNPWSFSIVFLALVSGFGAAWKLPRER